MNSFRGAAEHRETAPQQSCPPHVWASAGLNPSLPHMWCPTCKRVKMPCNDKMQLRECSLFTWVSTGLISFYLAPQNMYNYDFFSCFTLKLTGLSSPNMTGNVQSKELKITQMDKILCAINCSINALCKSLSCCWWYEIFAPKFKHAAHLKWTCLHQRTSAQITNISLKKLRQRNYIILQKCRSYIDSMFSFDSRHASTFKAPHIHFHARVITESCG